MNLLAVILVLLHAIVTVAVTLRSRQRYLPMRSALTPWQVITLRFGPCLVIYDLLLLCLIV